MTCGINWNERAFRSTAWTHWRLSFNLGNYVIWYQLSHLQISFFRCWQLFPWEVTGGKALQIKYIHYPFFAISWTSNLAQNCPINSLICSHSADTVFCVSIDYTIYNIFYYIIYLLLCIFNTKQKDIEFPVTIYHRLCLFRSLMFSRTRDNTSGTYATYNPFVYTPVEVSVGDTRFRDNEEWINLKKEKLMEI